MPVSIDQLITLLNLEGEYLFKAGQAAEAIAKFEQALVYDERNAETLNNMAIAHLHLGDCELALQCLTEALRAEPDHNDSFINVWKIFSKLGGNRQARDLYSAFMDLQASQGGESGILPNEGQLLQVNHSAFCRSRR